MWGKVVAFFAGMTFVFVLLFVFGMCGGHYHDSSHDYEVEEDDDEDEVVMVYISTSPRAKVYHVDPGCRWLRQTKHEIQEVSVEYAEAKGRRPCKGCSVE